MPLTSLQIESILRTHCNVEVAVNKYTSLQIESMVRVARAANTHLKINVAHLTSLQIESIGRLGGTNVTLVV